MPPAQRKNWRKYERFVAAMHSTEASIERTVIPNAKIKGGISGVERQIDLLIDARFEEDTSRRVIVDAKLHRRKLDVKDVESFEGMMKDCRAQHGILVCSSGYTPAALKRAQKAITIKLVTPEELDTLDPRGWRSCIGQCHTKSSRYSEHGWVLFTLHRNVTPGIAPNSNSIVGIGKCDVCHDFNIWCWECGQHFALVGNEAEYKCDCRRFWLTALEDEGIDLYGNKIESIVLIVVSLDSAQYRVVDRRPLQ